MTDFTMTVVTAGSSSNNLLGVRTRFVTISGRHDLVIDYGGEDFSDKGANVYINRGQRLLDQLSPQLKHDHRMIKALSIGDRAIQIDNPRMIKAVMLHTDSNGVKVELERRDWLELWRGYSDLTTNGVPRYWALGIDTPAPEIKSGFDPDDHEGAEDMASANFIDHTGILLNVPVSVAYTAHITGLWYTPDLVYDSDTSWWTITHPDLVEAAAQYWLARSYYNNAGAKEWLDAIRLQLTEVEKDRIATEMGDDWSYQEEGM